ncbi:MAG: transferase hexapeptide repeat family protein [Schleiferiaceae bacterium]|nr:transferase hexapeptide repeat family protein [Schleiferiaceae bacterium]MDG1220452.1 transferase hexapeptide repeat family protein [Schleiferiaceae bacterium]
MFYAFKGMVPVVDPSAFVHPQANVTGDVWVGKDVYIGPGAVLRGDWGRITIKEGANVQENCIIHSFPGKDVILEKSAHVGHGAIIHGAFLGENCLIGMNAVLMDDVQIGKNCLVGALAFVKARTIVPDGAVMVGNPAKMVKQMSEKDIAWKTEGTQWYQRLPKECHDTLTPCQPLQKADLNRPRGSGGLEPKS